MKKFSTIIIIILGFFLIFSYQDYMTPKITITYPKVLSIKQNMSIEINTKYHNTLKDFKDVKINFYHKYKKDEKVELSLLPYSEGKYQINYLPQFSGEYQGSVVGTINGKQISKEIQFNVK